MNKFLFLILFLFVDIAYGQNLKISQLPSITEAEIVSNDVLPIVDTSVTTTKKVSIGELDLRWAPLDNYVTALTGDVTATGPGSVAATIANSAVTNAKMANMADQRIKGNVSGGSAAPSDLTASQVTAFLLPFVGDSGSGGTQGLVPAPGIGDASNCLRGDATWGACGGGGGSYTFNDTDSIDLTDTSSTITADLNLSAAGADAGHINAVNSIESDGLQTQVPIASSSVSGALSSTDWSTFNGKQAAGNYVTALTGDVTASGPGSVAATIADDVVTNAKLAEMATLTIKGNSTGGTANPSDLSVSTVTGMLDVMVGDSGLGGTKGLVPAPGIGDASNCLLGDGTWGACGSGGGLPTTGGTMTGNIEFDDNLGIEPSATAQTLNIANSVLADVSVEMGTNATDSSYINIGNGGEYLGSPSSVITLNGTVFTGDITMGAGKEITLASTLGNYRVGFKAPEVTINQETIWSLPAEDGAAGEALITDGSGNLDWGASGMTNPMDATNDIIVGGASGTPTKKAMGSVGKALMATGSGLDYGDPGMQYSAAATGDVSITSSHRGMFLHANAASGDVTYQLPSASSNAGFYLTIEKSDSSPNHVIIEAFASNTFQPGAVTRKRLVKQFQRMEIYCDGTYYIVKSFDTANNVIKASSSTKTPTASGNYSAMSGGNVTLPQGIYNIDYSVAYGESGSSVPSYMGLGLFGANGADNGTLPAALSSIVTINTAYMSNAGLAPSRAIGAGSIFESGPTVNVTVPNGGATIYAVPIFNMTTPANARITVAITATQVGF